MTRIASLARRFTTPLLPDDYLTLFNPLLAFDTYRARIVSVESETTNVRTLHLSTVRSLPAHRAGQHVQVGVDIHGVRHWRTFSLTTPQSGSPNRELAITVKANGEGRVSDHLVHRALVGDILHLEAPNGDFTLPEPLPQRLLLIGAGSGVTPLLSMARTIRSLPRKPSVTFILAARNTQEMIARKELVALAKHEDWCELVLWPSAILGHLNVSAIARQVPDWDEAATFACGPPGMLTTLTAEWQKHGVASQLATERFQPTVLDVSGDGGTVTFGLSDRQQVADSGTSLLRAGEAAKIAMPSGCRMGICHTCVVPLRSGKVRDLRTGNIHGEPGEMIQTCINGAACDVELDI